jgi:hypothetical protein
MSGPTGKLKYAFDTIVQLNLKVEQLERDKFELVQALKLIEMYFDNALSGDTLLSIAYDLIEAYTDNKEDRNGRG